MIKKQHTYTDNSLLSEPPLKDESYYCFFKNKDLINHSMASLKITHSKLKFTLQLVSHLKVKMAAKWQQSATLCATFHHYSAWRKYKNQ